MTKTAYVFLLVIIGLSLLLHACDERSDRVVIHQAAAIALFDGVTEACQHRNEMRDAISATALSLHSGARRDEVRAMLRYEDCEKLGYDSVAEFRQRLEDKYGTDKLLHDLLKDIR